MIRAVARGGALGGRSWPAFGVVSTAAERLQGSSATAEP